MPIPLLFGVSILLSFIASGIVTVLYVWPYLRAIPTTSAIRILLMPHCFRFMGLAFLFPGVVSPDLPSAFAIPAAYGDLIAALLAMLCVWALSTASAVAIPLVWIFNLWGAADLLFAFYQGEIGVGVAPGQFQSTFIIPTVIVPALLITHALIFRLLLRGDSK
jgi:hypothetical protein